ncbi:hypothetical protein BJ875DRAFT_481201 [Amylocarpus encephaloides]|uniref:G domain-containing protein n=1 Tax=Amylocarpus encephaloides TaxID=45428 RepID=A0A9P7YPX5_9HELO|nr:hypothetical protein BJ875DRAFT_481201 [Amylocarpus encephaloides]
MNSIPVKEDISVKNLNDHGDNIVVLTAHVHHPQSRTSFDLSSEYNQRLWLSRTAWRRETNPIIKPGNDCLSLLRETGSPGSTIVPLSNVTPKQEWSPLKRDVDASSRLNQCPAPYGPFQPAENWEQYNKEKDGMVGDDEDSLARERAEQNNRLQKVIQAPVEVLEAEVKNSRSLLNTLMKHFKETSVESKDTKHWINAISALQKQNVDPPTIIGVVGNTGVGKSSVINAILDEERLVPTNCMRACTAVVTEMSWNNSDKPNAKYRADIEFIDPKDWEKDSRMSVAELKDDNGGIVRDCTNADSEAGIAYAKIKAEMLGFSSIEALMNDKEVKAVFGTTKNVERSKPEVFYKALQHYVDSKEKGTGEKKSWEKDNKRELEFWPPKRWCAYMSRPMLFRLELYWSICLWIVAPIGRAVDDKAAKNLLGESFKRQLKFDGIYSRVTFICSKTDDISITEATESLDLEEDMTED